jgi:hypothetical protein
MFAPIDTGGGGGGVVVGRILTIIALHDVRKKVLPEVVSAELEHVYSKNKKSWRHKRSIGQRGS